MDDSGPEVDTIANLALLRIEREYAASLQHGLVLQPDDDLTGILSQEQSNRDMSMYNRRVADEDGLSSDEDDDKYDNTDTENQMSADESENLPSYVALMDDAPDEEFSDFITAPHEAFPVDETEGSNRQEVSTEIPHPTVAVGDDNTTNIDAIEQRVGIAPLTAGSIILYDRKYNFVRCVLLHLNLHVVVQIRFHLLNLL